MVSSISGSSYGTQVMEAMRQNRFKKIDQDSDGKITKEEMSAGKPQNGKGPSVDDIFSKVDTNQDGAIDETEDKAALAQMQQAQPNRQSGPPPGGPRPDPAKMAQEIFKTTDTDSDGKVTKDELTTALKNSSTDNSDSSKVDEIFKAADTDGDGTITQAELAAYMEKMQASQAPPTPPANSSYGSSMVSRTTDKLPGSLLSAVA